MGREIINKIMKFFGYVRCRECNKWTTLCMAGNICSWDCFESEKEKTGKYAPLKF